jgi:hypothetical protein
MRGALPLMSRHITGDIAMALEDAQFVVESPNFSRTSSSSIVLVLSFAFARAHCPREDDPRRLCEAAAADLEFNVGASGTDRRCLAVADVESPAGEVKELEQE